MAVAAIASVYLFWPNGGDDGEPDSAAMSSSISPLDSPEPETPSASGPPKRLEIPGLDVDAPVTAIETDGNVLDPPSDPQTVGWWSSGVQPGADTGSALLAGHSVHDGHGALQELADAGSGDAVRIEVKSGAVEYAITDVQVLDKDELAEQAESLFDQTVEGGRLVVVSCEDWDGTDWLKNVVMTAEPVE